MSGETLNINYQAPGPVSNSFYESRAPVSGIMGPIGSSKTTVALMKMLLIASTQKKSNLDGVRYTKFRVIRDTYSNLEETTIPSWHTWVPASLGIWRGPKGRPKTHHLKFNIAAKGMPQDIVDVKIEFIALGPTSLEEVMKGWEGTGVYVNEADGVPYEGIVFAYSRCARYPSMIHGGPSWTGLWVDFNAPDDDNWTYEHLVDNLPDGWEFYVQPSGFSPNAENLQNLPDNYYQDKSNGMPTWWVRRFIENKFGMSRDGKLVFEDYNDEVHCAHSPLVYDPRSPIILGGDQGRNGAIVIFQKTPIGQWRGLREIIAHNVGAERFGKLAAQELHDHFPDVPIAHAWGDPAGTSGSDHDERSYWEIMTEVMGVRWKPSPVPRNNWTDRCAAVERNLMRMIDGEPAFLISPTMKVLRKGFNSRYVLKKIATSAGTDRFHDRPEKGNGFDGVQDATQYLLCGGGEHMAVKGRKQGMNNRRSFSAAKSNFRVI